jgi:hypothetical protein
MNALSAAGFLNEQPLVYRSLLFRRITKALRERNTTFIRDLAKALANTDHPALISKTARQFRQITSALSSTGDPALDSLLEKLRNSEWLRRARPEEIRALESKLLRRLDVKGETFEKSVEAEIQDPGRPKEKKPIKVQKTVYSTDTSQKTQPPPTRMSSRTGRSTLANRGVRSTCRGRCAPRNLTCRRVKAGGRAGRNGSES